MKMAGKQKLPAIVVSYSKLVYCDDSTSLSSVRTATPVGPFA